VTAFPTAPVAGISVLLMGLVVAAAEGLSGEMRVPIYAGGAAGLIAAGVGLAFAVKIARLDLAADKNGAFWKWWGGGMMARFGLVATLGLILMAVFPKQPAAALFSMMGVYLLGMFAESAWLAQVFFKADKTGASAPKQSD
jgi:hypothetical protein